MRGGKFCPLGKQERGSYSPRDHGGWDNFGNAIYFCQFFSPLAKWWSPSGKSPSAFGLVVPRESKNFVSFGQLSFGRVKNFCPSGVLTHPLRTKIFHSPSGQLASGNKILTLPQDNKGLRPQEKEKSKKFLPSLSAPILWYLLSNKINFLFFRRPSNFFRAPNLIFLDY